LRARQAQRARSVERLAGQARDKPADAAQVCREADILDKPIQRQCSVSRSPGCGH
jgi:hypothetical protein